MSEFENTSADPAPDTEMTGADAAEAAETTEVAETSGPAEAEASAELPFAEEQEEEEEETRKSFADYLSSPVVSLLVGRLGEEKVLTAHQALLVKSPYFRDVCATFADDGSPRHIDLAEETVDGIGCFLEYLYTGDYFPRKLPGQRTLEPDPSVPSVDDDGAQLLRHARVYTLASRFGLPELRTLASGKIHCVNSTAKGEIEYARYVYGHTEAGDKGARAPVAQFWATRSHVLRSEAEEEFRGLCLEFPQFGYDVLTRVLDDKLKRDSREKMQPQPGSARKRQRQRQSLA